MCRRSMLPQRSLHIRVVSLISGAMGVRQSASVGSAACCQSHTVCRIVCAHLLCVCVCSCFFLRLCVYVCVCLCFPEWLVCVAASLCLPQSLCFPVCVLSLCVSVCVCFSTCLSLNVFVSLTVCVCVRVCLCLSALCLHLL